MSLAGKHILIAGGSSGIGLATAHLAIAADARVSILGRRQEQVDAAVAELSSGTQGYVVDVAREEEVASLPGTLGAIDHIFYTPGPFLADESLELPEELLRESMEVRFWSAVRLLKVLLPQMSRSGSVVLMSGTANWRPEGSPVALAALGAVETFVRSMAVSNAPLRFNAIAPGLTYTSFLRSFLGEDHEQVLSSLAQIVPLKRFGTPEEVAHAALFLMDNGYVNGITLTVDGGARLV